MPYFHRLEIDSDPDELLDPANQYSTPWGSPDHGACDKCHAEGEIEHRCLSCLEEGPNPDCPACGGQVEFRRECPTCEGSGEISRTRRDGVSVFPSIAGLYRYLAEREEETGIEGSVIVELEGPLSEDRDLDADSGALLIRPAEVVAVHPLDLRRIRSVRERIG